MSRGGARRDKRQRVRTPLHGERTVAELLDLVAALDRLVALRNLVVSDLREYLTDDHKLLLGWPLDAVGADAVLAARRTGRLEPIGASR